MLELLEAEYSTLNEMVEAAQEITTETWQKAVMAWHSRSGFMFEWLKSIFIEL